MSVAGIYSTAPSQTFSAQQSRTSSPGMTWQEYVKQRRVDVQALSAALKTGDLNAAKQAYNTLVTLGNTLPGDNAFVRSDRAMDFNAIGGALDNGNLGQAQKALTALQDTFMKAVPVQSGGSTPADLSSNAAPAGANSAGAVNGVNTLA